MKKVAFPLLLAVLLTINGCQETDLPGTIPNPPVTSDQGINDEWDDFPWPAWIFSHWVWEDESTQASAQQLIDDYLAHDIPVGAIILDSPWETGYNTFDFDSTLYPDPQGMIDYIHSKDVKVMMWIVSMINTDVQPMYDYADSMGYFMETFPGTGSAVLEWWKGDGSLLDFFNPDAVDWWKSHVDKTLALGIDGWKCDGTDFSAILASWSPGANEFVSRLDYSHAYYRFFHDYTREQLDDNRVNTARPIDNYGVADIGGEQVSFAPVDINWAGWVGDQDATFEGLEAALNNMYHSYEMGYLAFGSDIGGYREDNNYPQGRSKEVFIRWAQLGAFSPIMENGGGGEHRPWMFDTETTDIYRTMVKLHHVLIPYLMDCSKPYFDQGRSLMEFVNKDDYSFLLGPNIFVTPIMENTNEVTINFPAGKNWVYIFDEEQIFEGGTTVTMTFGLDEYPAFMQEGIGIVDVIDIDELRL